MTMKAFFVFVTPRAVLCYYYRETRTLALGADGWLPDPSASIHW
jgi:hypothetical protein